MIPSQNYTIHSSSPTPIYLYGLQKALTVINIGDVDVYVTSEPSLSNGYLLEVGRSVGWEAGKALYAYTTAASGVIQVFEGTVNGQDAITVNRIEAPVTVNGTVDVDGDVSIDGPVEVFGSVGIQGTVNAAIAGDVNANIVGGSVDITSGVVNATIDGGTVNIGGVDTPVFVQGGAELLLDEVVETDIGEYAIPASSFGLIYASYTISVELVSGDLIGWQVADLDVQPGSVTLRQTFCAGAVFDDSSETLSFGTTQETVSFPNISSSSTVYLQVYSEAGSATARVRIYGSNIQLEKPVTDLSLALRPGRLSGTTGEVLFPPTHTPFVVGAYLTPTAHFTTSGTNILAIDGSWPSHEPQPISYPRPSSVADPGTKYVTVGGHGYPVKMSFTTSASTGFFFLKQ